MASGVRGLLIYCSDCSHWTAISGGQWPDDVRLSDLERKITCQACGRRGADIRPHFDWEQEARRTNAQPLLSTLAPHSPRTAPEGCMVFGLKMVRPCRGA
jgi:hypothetical protein